MQRISKSCGLPLASGSCGKLPAVVLKLGAAGRRPSFPVITRQVKFTSTKLSCSARPPTEEQSESKQAPPKAPKVSKKDDKNNLKVPIPPPRVGTEQYIGTMIAHIGTIGTLACALAWAFNVDVFGNFHWDAQDVKLGLIMVTPLMVLEAILMVPDYSSWKLPKDPAELARLQDLQKGSSSKSAFPNSSFPMDGPMPTQASVTPIPVKKPSQPQLPPKPSSSSSSASAKAVPANSWGLKEADPPPFQKTLRNAMHLAQGAFLVGAPNTGVNPAAEMALLFGDSLATEMLWRGAGLSIVANWLCDRLYEGGADDVIFVHYWLAIPTTQMAQLLATVALGVFVTLMVMRRMLRVRNSFALLVDLRAKDSKPVKKKVVDMAAHHFDALVWSHAVKGGVELAELTVLSLVFVVTGNLAASLAASCVNQLLFWGLQRHAVDRVRKKSSVMAKDMDAINKAVREIAAKRKMQVSNYGDEAVSDRRAIADQASELDAAIAAATAALQCAASAAAATNPGRVAQVSFRPRAQVSFHTPSPLTASTLTQAALASELSRRQLGELSPSAAALAAALTGGAVTATSSPSPSSPSGGVGGLRDRGAEDAASIVQELQQSPAAVQLAALASAAANPEPTPAAATGPPTPLTAMQRTLLNLDLILNLDDSAQQPPAKGKAAAGAQRKAASASTPSSPSSSVSSTNGKR